MANLNWNWPVRVTFRIVVGILFSVMSCAPRPAEHPLGNQFQFAEYADQMYKNSYLIWIINEDGLPVDEAEARARASKYPTEQALYEAVEYDFNKRFSPGTDVNEFIAVMQLAGATCMRTGSATYSMEHKKPIEPDTGPALCRYDQFLPLPHSQKIFDPDEIKSLDHAAAKRGIEEFLKWQEEARFRLSWQFEPVGQTHENDKLTHIDFRLRDNLK